MQCCQSRLLSRHHACTGIFPLRFTAIFLPCPPDLSILHNRFPVNIKQKIASRHKLFPILCKKGKSVCVIWIPGFKIPENRFCLRCIYLLQNVTMKFLAGLETLPASLGLSFFIHSKQITGIVTQEICLNI